MERLTINGISEMARQLLNDHYRSSDGTIAKTFVMTISNSWLGFRLVQKRK